MRKKNKIAAITAYLLLLALVSPMLIQPLHLLVAHHEVQTEKAPDKATLSQVQDDCSICDFKYISAIAPEVAFFGIQPIHIYTIVILFYAAVLCSTGTRLRKGRAPPVL